MTCPICQKASDADQRPFCSKRCADIDLGKWLGGDYAVASNDPEDLMDAQEALLRERPH